MIGIILAGGMGDRLWPLSRKNLPKQFLNLRNNRSFFQETITRNLPLCDRFYVVTQTLYEMTVRAQLVAFQGLTVHVLCETSPGGTAGAVSLALGREEIADTETVLLLPSDLLLDKDAYADAVFRAREETGEGRLCLFGVRPTHFSPSYGYIFHEGNTVTGFVEKPERAYAERLFARPDVLVSSGMLLAKAGDLRRELSVQRTGVFFAQTNARRAAHSGDTTASHPASDTSRAPGSTPPVISFEQTVLAECKTLRVVEMEGRWEDISDFPSFEQLLTLPHEKGENGSEAFYDRGPSVVRNGRDTSVINTCADRLTVVNGLDRTLVVSTPDAVYVTDRDHADDIRQILHDHQDEYSLFFDESPILYRSWGVREVIRREKGFRVRRVTLYPGQRISRHLHERRNENYSVVSGTLSVEVEGRLRRLRGGDGINIFPGQMHCLFNETDEEVVAIEVDTGEEITEMDMVSREEACFAQALSDPDASTLPVLYRLAPAYKDYLWGGSRLRDQFKKETPYSVTAESWELSAHPDGPAVIRGGPLDGMPFDRFADRYAFASGWKSRIFERFPILIKFIDACRPLSVQVHPGDDYAFVHEGEFGKNECWYVLDAEPDAFVYCGLKEDMTRDALRDAILDGTIENCMNRIPVNTGDVIFVPAGTLHAIGAGILICEIQQSSNSTYRVYDYNRRDAEGKTRPLHLDKAMDVVSLSAFRPSLSGVGKEEHFEHSDRQLLASCRYFECVRYRVPEAEDILMDESSFKAFIVLSGDCVFRSGDEQISARAGDCIYARSGRRVVHVSGSCELLAVNV